MPDIRRNEILRLLESGLEDISVSRAGQAWGIPMPEDPGSVIYVWVDALINYATAVGFGTDQALFDTWWPADLHVIGKDITRFHCVIWPAMLMSAGLPVPKQVFGHGWVHFRGEKMSKSLGTAVEPLDAAQKFGPDPLRLYLVKEIAFGSDGDFTWERFEERYNVDLANNLGNLVSRVATMAEKYRAGELTAAEAPGRLAEVAASRCGRLPSRTWTPLRSRPVPPPPSASSMRPTSTSPAREPWALARDPGQAARLSQVLFDVAEALRIAAVLLLPIMPRSAARDSAPRRRNDAAGAAARSTPRRGATDGTRAIIKGAAMWPRVETTEFQEYNRWQRQPRAPSAQPLRTLSAEPRTLSVSARTLSGGSAARPSTEKISIEDFMKVDLRVAKVLTAEKVPNSRKLVKLSIDLGTEQRTLVAGIAEAYEPEQLVGRTIVMVFNLKPAKLMGIESNGMVLAASPDGGKPTLVGFDAEIPPGTRVR